MIVTLSFAVSVQHNNPRFRNDYPYRVVRRWQASENGAPEYRTITQFRTQIEADNFISLLPIKVKSE